MFQDVLAFVVPDVDHSNGEKREIIMGYSIQGRLLVVSFAKREDVFRIISARHATKKERRRYEEFNEGYL